MEHRDDITLVQLSLVGDSCAFEGLVRRHYDMVYRVAYKWCGIREDAEDIAQDVFVKLAKKLHRFHQKSSFKTWLYRITINTAKDVVRKRTTHSTHEAAFAFQQGRGNPAGQTPEDHLRVKHLYGVLEKLPEKQKAAMVLVFGEGLSHRAAAQVLNCRETTISWRIYQARKKLKKFLGHAT